MVSKVVCYLDYHHNYVPTRPPTRLSKRAYLHHSLSNMQDMTLLHITKIIGYTLKNIVFHKDFVTNSFLLMHSVMASVAVREKGIGKYHGVVSVFCFATTYFLFGDKKQSSDCTFIFLCNQIKSSVVATSQFLLTCFQNTMTIVENLADVMNR